MTNGLRKTRLFKLSTYTIDILLIHLSIFITFWLRYDFNIPAHQVTSFFIMAPWIAISYIVLMFVFGLEDILKQNSTQIAYSIFFVVTSLLVTTAFISYFSRTFDYPRSILIFSTFIQFITLSLWRFIVLKLERNIHGVKECLLIGNNSAEKLAEKIILKNKKLYDIKYICNDKSKNIDTYLDETKTVFICSDVDYSIRNKIIERCITEGKEAFLVPSIYEVMLLEFKLDRVDDTPVLRVDKIGLTIEQRFIKRLVDIILAMGGIILTAPVMLIIAMLIKFSDGGEILFKQERVTINKKKFNVLKFRTMVMNAEKLTGPVLATDNDPRITKLGHILRATRLDEFPQFFNILFGDMSVVGPRPERPHFVEKFEGEVEAFKHRTIVKAGLTGFAQVYGKYNTTPEDKAKYDLLYIKNYSIFLDFKLILLTIKIMFTKESTEGIKQKRRIEELIKEKNLKTVIEA